MSEWVLLESLCDHCGMEIEAKYDVSYTGICISGIHPLIYRHAHNKSEECVIVNRYKVKPYSGFTASKEWDKKRGENQ